MPPIIDTITSLIFLIGKGSPYIDYNNYIKARYSYGVSSFLMESPSTNVCKTEFENTFPTTMKTHNFA